jgi:hypothetical protein
VSRIIPAAATAALVLTSAAPAAFIGATAIDVSASLGTPAGLRTWRLFANFDDPADQLLAVGGLAGRQPIVFSSTSPLVNEGGAFAGLSAEDLAGFPVSAAWDSYVTIGDTELAGNETWLTPGFAGGDGVESVVEGTSWSEDDGGWFDSYPSMGPTGGSALLAQFTFADAPLEFTLSGLAFWFEGGVHDEQMQAPFVVSVQVVPAPGTLAALAAAALVGARHRRRR